jgi:O-antigen ligase
MWALGAVLLVQAWQIQQFYPVLQKLRPAVLTAAPALAFLFLNNDPRRSLQSLRTPLARVIVVLVLIMGLSVLTSFYATKSVIFLLQDFSWTLGVCTLIALSIRSGRDVQWLALCHVAGAVLLAGIRLMSFQGGPGARLGTGAYDANDMGLLMVATLPFAVFFLRGGAKTWHRLIALGALVIMTVTLVKTGSRGGFLAFVVTMGYILFTFRALKPQVRVFAAVVGFVVSLAVGSETYWERIQTIFRPQEDYNWSEQTLSGRMAVWKRGLSYMLGNPVLGVGVACFPVAEGSSPAAQMQAQFGRGFKWSVAHNSFVEIGAELGVFGLAAYVAFFWLAFRTLNRVRRIANDGSDAALAQALFASLLGFAVAGFFLSQAYYVFPFSLFGMIVGFTKLYPAAFARPRPARARARASLGHWPPPTPGAAGPA